jgi:hypothetical protein
MTTPYARVIAATVLFAITVVAATDDWRLPPSQEQMLPDSVDCWKPALAGAPSGPIFVIAGKRNAPPGSNNSDQQQVVWRSDDRGKTFTGPLPVSTEGHWHYDERIAIDANGTI